ncbi:MAG: D-alanine--D-alanine ligase [Bacteroidales bacterium]|jgi:D-alanine-D-alanine ligase|nr:D-alanine--D-alanine ligase [Bacteroidales bacterium]
MKKNIALLLGGDSSEAVISVKSAGQVMRLLDHDLFNVYPITVKGDAWMATAGDRQIAVNKNDFSVTDGDRHIRFDCALPMIHGTPGENGLLQAYFELLHIPYTTCDVLTSSLTFNKHACKTYLNALGILFPKGKLIRRGEKTDAAQICALLGLPCFVKPNNGGSSFGVTKVKTEEELLPALDAAFAEDAGEALVEEFIEGTEITCGVVKLDGEIIIFPITEIVSKKDFFDMEAKYKEGMSEEITPARISASLHEDCHTISRAVYQHLNCRGIVRIDYIVHDGKLYFLEVNTVPGMSEASIIPKQIGAMGAMSVKELYTRLIREAIAEGSEINKL